MKKEKKKHQRLFMANFANFFFFFVLLQDTITVTGKLKNEIKEEEKPNLSPPFSTLQA